MNAHHSFVHRGLCFLTMLIAGIAVSWGQTDYSGTYFLAMPGTGSYSAESPADNYYLVPTEGWCYYVATNNVQAADNGQPFLTTYKCGHVSKAKWIIQKHATEQYYYIKHLSDDKYLTYNGTLTGASANRARVHLEASITGDNNLFAITTTTTDGVTKYFISSKTETNQYLNITDGNKDSYAGATGKSDGPTGYADVGGILGRWNQKNNTSEFYIEPATSIDPPTITNNNDGTFSITAATGSTIYYTTDGTNPTLTAYTGTGTTSVAVNQTASMTVIKAIAKAASDAIPTDITTYELPVCDVPAISFDNATSMVSISCATAGATIHYTTDGGTPTASSTAYSNTFSVSSTTTVKAIAVKPGSASSAVKELVISQVATPTIQNNGSNAISITTDTPGATIYYTTNGSNPTTSSTEYTGPLTENVSNVTIKAIAVKAGMITSVVGSGTVKLQCATPVITRDGMTFSLSCSMPTDANLYYTLGSEAEVAYTGSPVTFTPDQLPIIVKASARHSNYTNSETASMELTSGTGTPEDPYMIYGAADFTDFVTNVNDGTTASACYKLGSDVSASGFTTIATIFSGTLEAAINPETQMPYRITDLDAPLFATLTGTVKNLVLEDVDISGNAGNTGAIACIANDAARIYNVGILSGSVGGTDNTGGLVGFLDGTARVVNCYSYADITSGTNKGGIVGNNNVASTQSNVATMVMNCMFYGTIASGGTISPVFGGQNIDNKNAGGLATYNYYLYRTDLAITNNKYNCALAVEEKFFTRFEFFRQLENSNKKLASIYATGSAENADQKMLKWVLETADRTISNPKPYPILKAQGYYPSIINYDADNAPTLSLENDKPKEADRNKGGKLGILSVTISGVGSNAPSGAKLLDANGNEISTSRTITLARTDKDFGHFNFNYDKVQLPYYNDYGTKNYTSNKVVTGWKITSITGGTAGTFTATDEWGGYNFADRNCTKKDLYSESGRVFSQGAYFEVPYGVTAITIEPYWGVAAYVSDQYYDVVYKEQNKNNYAGQSVNVSSAGLGTQATNDTDITINGSTQKVYTSINNARTALNISTDVNSGKTVYDYAVVLVGNVHQAGPLSGDYTPYTITSVDLDKDNEPDYSFIFSHYNRQPVSPIRFDFLNVVGSAQAQKPNGTSVMLNVSIFKPKGWFEVTNTCNIYFVQFEGYNGENKTPAPIILLGGVVDQFTSTQNQKVTTQTQYIHLGSNCWFKAFGNGTHSDGFSFTQHVPVSVTGGDFDGFYLSGVYRPDAGIQQDNAECYISSGRFNEVAGAAQQMIDGDVHWQIYNADITNFYGGGINAAKPITGDITVDIINSYVNTYCGGPKFGDMQKSGTTFTTKYSTNQAGTTSGTYSRPITKDGKVTTNATGCWFNKFFGAGYGGTSYSELKFYDNTSPNFSNLQSNYTNDRGKYFNGENTAYKSSYGNKGPGIATDFSYEFFVWSSGSVGARFYVKYASFSLAQCNDVESKLKSCILEDNFYGGGSIGKVTGTATSELEDCNVKGSVYAGGYSASLPTIPIRNSGFTTAPKFNNQSGMFEPGVFSETTDFEWTAGTLTENATAINTSDGNKIYTDADLSTLGLVANTNLTIKGTTTVTGSVYGGGEESGVGGATEVNILNGAIGTDVFGGGKEGDIHGSVLVNMQGGTVTGSLYGGGALANTNINNVSSGYGTDSETISSTSTNTTTVNLLGGTINGDAYGGGLGQLGNEPVAAMVYGDVNVNLGSLSSTSATAFNTSYYTGEHANIVKSGRLFGCNNLNGSPKGEVTVTVYRTVPGNYTRTAADKLKLKETDDGYVAPTYELTAVYGGGNLADFTTPVTGKKANVITETCNVSVRDVYGGGNAAAVPETNVLIRGAYEIQEVFGGGNGKDPYSLDGGTTWVDNLGANVNGNANTLLTGGYIHEAYGGSNDKGTITGSVTIDVGAGDNDPNHCELDAEKLVGAGKNADVEGDLVMILGCKPDVKIPQLFCGADNANVHGNVEMTITSGKFGQVFGGNNQGGAILGHIILNIEETGDCEVPIEIDELYLGGNEAAYSVYGYYNSGEMLSNGKPKYLPRTAEMNSITDPTAEGYQAPITNPAEDATHTFPYTQPILNIVSCTRIGKIFGGGLGAGAAMYADPTVNINMIPGKHASSIPDDINNPNKLGLLGDVYGGGNEAAVYGNTTVNIGTMVGQPITLTSTGETANVVGAFISGTVYGAGKGKADDPATAIVTGNTLVNMAGGHVSRSIYGGGELGSVGTFTETYTAEELHPYHAVGEPKKCKEGTGLTKVLISGGQVGLVNQLMPDPANPTSDDDYGYVFCASKGVADSLTYTNANLLAVSDSAYLEISGTALIAASVYGGSENGQVLGDTHVKIKGGQIGTGHYVENNTNKWDPAYTEGQWTAAINAIKSGVETDINTAAAPFHQCHAWPFGDEGHRHVYDHYAGTEGYDAKGGETPGSDGHSFFGHVFGGGSGFYPFAAGKWRRTAGRVNGNTMVEIIGGHILTNVYGGNEITDVLGSSKVVMKAGTVGLPRTIDSIQARPVNSYIFGAGMGDPRVLFNGWSNVASAEVIVDSVAVVFGSVFGGGEDGHVLGDVSTTIKGDALIGTFGSSGVDGNIFGSGRGFSGIALTAGAVCGNVTVNIAERAKILGSVFGGGRMAAVGTFLAAEDAPNYGKLQTGNTHGNVTINITGGTIGNLSQMSTSQYSIGDVFGGSKGIFINNEWARSQKLGLVKNTTVNISQAEGSTTTIYGNVYGGGEIASVGSYTYATAAQATTYNTTHTSEPMTEGDVYALDEAGTGHATILITGGTIGQNSLADAKGSVFGGCLGKAGTTYSGYSFVNNSDVTLQGGTVYGCIFGGGENGHVFNDTDVKIKSGTVGIPLHDKVIANLSDAEKDNMIYRGNVYGGGRGIDKTSGNDYSITAGKVDGNTNVTVEGGTIYRNVYGGGSLASVGVREETKNQSLVTATHPFPYATGLATVTIKGGTIGTDGGASANNYNTNVPDRESRKENGFVFGSGRGMAAGAVGNSTLVQLAYTKNTLVSIEGTGNVTGSVFGGGENGHVSDNTKVYIKENCFVGTELIEAEHVLDDNGRGRLLYRGNVYGGGRGIDTDGNGNYSLTAGRVYGNTFVEVSGGKIYHDVFGGGSLASVGNETINSSTGEITYGDDSGEAEVHIKGGIIGYSSNTDKQGFNCGFVYGGCRGLSAAPNTDIVKMAYVHDSKVYIEPGADVKGSVFGGGANGHVKNDTYVEISGGSIGTALLADEVGFDDHGVAAKSVFRGNVYAGGRGVDMFQVQQQGETAEKYSMSAGAVYGNAELKMTGGHVWHNIYGSGAMASVGTVQQKPANTHVHDEIVDANGVLVNNVIYNPDESDINYLTGVFKENTGKVTILITGGTVGDTTQGHEGVNNGNVFGAGRGVSASRSDYVASMEYVNETFVTIGTSGQTSYTGNTPSELNYPYIYGNVYGGGENGHVKTDTHVKIYSGMIGWPLVEGTEGKYKEADDGSTKNPYRGHVFGGGCGVDPLYHQSTETRSSTAGRVYGHTNVEMTGGVVRRAIYGGGMLASVGVYRLLQSDLHITDMIEDKIDAGDATVTISGGYVGNVNPDGTALTGTGYLVPGDNNGFVFGSSCGMVADEYTVGGQQVDIQYRQMGYTHSTHVNISGTDTHIFGCVFGSGENGHVWEDAIINISGGQIGSQNNNSIYVGNVYGSGRGVDHPHAHISETAGKVRGNTTVNITGGTIWRDVYGGGSLASVGESDEIADNSKKNITDDPTTNNPFPYSTGLTRVIIDGTTTVVHGSVYGSGRGVASTETEYKQAAYVKNTLVTIKGSARVYQNVFGGGNAGHVRKNTDVTLNGSAKIDGNVYGGGAGDISSPTAGLVNHDVAVNIKGGLIGGDVYGGGAIANTNVHDKRNSGIYGKPSENVFAKTTVNLTGGIILGDAYGGGQGVIAPDGASDAEKANAGALVRGDVTVTLNGTAFLPTTTTDDQGNDIAASGRVFGCNNLNGTPQGTVLVKVLRTIGLTENNGNYVINNTKPTLGTNTYEVQAVYGGGNLAAYVPWDGNATGQYTDAGIVATGNPLQVVIEGCDLTSIEYVYGGGNAASVPSTQVVVNGAYEIGTVFGGGNGKDKYSVDGGTTWTPNPGANVGYHDYMEYQTVEGNIVAVEKNNAKSKSDRETYYAYGSGKAHAILYGGTVYGVYGGSNNKGNIRVEARATLEDHEVCEFNVGEAYGGGRNAMMDGNAVLEIGCISGMGKAYGGAANADVNGNVELNISNGTYGQVFGGNDMGGAIRGSITVNIQETGCRPIIIGELYGGGNEAAYSVYGYDANGVPLTSGDNKQDDPQLNVRSFTSIGAIYGGGYGVSAKIVGNTNVNIDVFEGKFKETVIVENSRVIGSTVKKPGDTGYSTTEGFEIPSHAANTMGAIGTVFGGGNAAEVDGNTNVRIGTEMGTEVYEAVTIAVGKNVTGYYTRIGEGTTANPYSYSEASGTAAENTTYYQKKTVLGADIRGDVFGGGLGKTAIVSGNTNVVVGR